MNIRIKTDLEAEPLTLAVMSQFLKYEDNQTAENTLISSMISSVRTILEQRTGLVFAAKTFEVHFDPSDYPFVIPVYPIISVDSMVAIDYQGTETDLTLNTDYYKTGMYEIDLIVNSLLNYDVMAESDKYKDRYKVTCKAGYGDDDTETLPVALLNAMQSQVFQWYQNRDDFHEGNVLGLINKAVMLFKREFI